MKRYELTIKILDPAYVNTLVVALVRQGYSPYLSDDGDVCFTISGEELHEVKFGRIDESDV